MPDQPSGSVEASIEPAIPAVLYAAKSTPDEKDSNVSQLQECRRRALDELGRRFLSEHEEDNKSGWKGDRGNELEAALLAAEGAATEFGGAELWVWKSERLARGSGRKNEARSLLEVFTRCKRAGVTLRSVIDDAYVQDEAMVGMASKMAEKYSADLSVNVAQGFRREVAKGRYFGPPPLGYRFEGRKEDSHLVPVPEEVVTVERIFREWIEGRSMSGIAKSLNQDGVRTKTGVYFRQAQISGILRNKLYVGKVRYKDEGLFDGVHDAIIDADTFAKAERLIEALPKRPGRRPSVKRHLFLNGFLRCGVCGDCMTPIIRPKANYESYECQGKIHGCNTGAVRRRDIDDDVLAYFEQNFYDAAETRRQIKAVASQRQSEVESLIPSAESEVDRARERLARVKRDYMHGEITAPEWRELRTELEQDRDGAEAEVEQLRIRLTEVQADAALGEADAAVMDQLAQLRAEVAGEVDQAGSIDALRAVLARLFDSFRFHPELPAHANVELVGGRYWIEPVVSKSVVEGMIEREGPALIVPQALGQAEKNYSLGSGWL